jgi:hypothetical protein
MGLDITAYERVKRTPRGGVDGDDLENGFTRLYVNPDFPGRADEIENRAVYEVSGEELDFRAGSYSGYNAWRDQLAQLVGRATAREVWEDPKPGPFVELINFADNEGTIGAGVAKKLAADFALWQPQADAHGDEWFRQHYALWRRAFEIAAKGGAVCFH